MSRTRFLQIDKDGNYTDNVRVLQPTKSAFVREGDRYILPLASALTNGILSALVIGLFVFIAKSFNIFRYDTWYFLCLLGFIVSFFGYRNSKKRTEASEEIVDVKLNECGVIMELGAPNKYRVAGVGKHSVMTAPYYFGPFIFNKGIIPVNKARYPYNIPIEGVPLKSGRATAYGNLAVSVSPRNCPDILILRNDAVSQNRAKGELEYLDDILKPHIQTFLATLTENQFLSGQKGDESLGKAFVAYLKDEAVVINTPDGLLQLADLINDAFDLGISVYFGGRRLNEEVQKARIEVRVAELNKDAKGKKAKALEDAFKKLDKVLPAEISPELKLEAALLASDEFGGPYESFSRYNVDVRGLENLDLLSIQTPEALLKKLMNKGGAKGGKGGKGGKGTK